MALGVPIDRGVISHFCRQHHIRTFGVLGSALRADFGAESDVDVLVEFDPGHVPGLLGIAGMELELMALLGRKVDIRTAQDLSHYFRDEVVRTAEILYVS